MIKRGAIPFPGAAPVKQACRALHRVRRVTCVRRMCRSIQLTELSATGWMRAVRTVHLPVSRPTPPPPRQTHSPQAHVTRYNPMATKQVKTTYRNTRTAGSCPPRPGPNNAERNSKTKTRDQQRRGNSPMEVHVMPSHRPTTTVQIVSSTRRSRKTRARGDSALGQRPRSAIDRAGLGSSRSHAAAPKQTGCGNRNNPPTVVTYMGIERDREPWCRHTSPAV